MNDLIIFGMGCLVSLVVASAVALLLWGAANEPRGSVLPTKEPDQDAPPFRQDPRASVPATSLESKGIA